MPLFADKGMLSGDKVGLFPLNISVSGFRGFEDCTVYICAILKSLKSVRILFFLGILGLFFVNSCARQLIQSKNNKQ